MDITKIKQFSLFRFLIAGLTNGTINIYPVDLRRIVGDNYATAGNQ